jgi:predicted esterase
MLERTIAASTHGRYLVQPPATPGPAPLLVGFHGYAEGAEAQLDRLRAVPGVDRWRIASIQGLNRFYQRRTNDVIAGWMTRQDRELAIADNLAYVAAVIDAIGREWPASPRVVFAGFSQGVAMTFRAAVAAPAVDGVIAVGGDVPPEIAPPALARIPAVLICRGTRDEWYAAETFDNDVKRLREAGTVVESFPYDAGHEWSNAIAEAAGRFLRERLA